MPPSCCSSANFTCPDLGLNPTAVLPQVDQYLAATHCVEHFSLQMESGCFSVLLAGTVPALAASLAVVAVFQLAGALLACCLARYCSLQIPIVYHPQPHLGWLPLRRGNGMSSVITDRRESSGTKLEISANCGCFCPEEESLKSRDGKFLQRNLLPCIQPSLLPFSPLPYSLFRQ